MWRWASPSRTWSPWPPGLARQGLLPVVNSFASFLASRANEQIYNAASEDARIVYGCHYAGLIPAGPGKSHQSLRDASLLAALPNVVVVHPANAEETRAVVEWAVARAVDSVAIRLAIGPSPRRIGLPRDYRLALGRGTVLMEGRDAVALAYGPVMLHETLTAADALRARSVRLSVVDMPWLNRFDAAWLGEAVAPFEHVFVVEDHAPVGALGDALRRELQRPLNVYGVEGGRLAAHPQRRCVSTASTAPRSQTASLQRCLESRGPDHVVSAGRVRRCRGVHARRG